VSKLTFFRHGMVEREFLIIAILVVADSDSSTLDIIERKELLYSLERLPHSLERLP
jgi:hypothetical protein